MTLHLLNRLELDWNVLSSLGKFLSLSDLANLSVVRRGWCRLLDHPSMEEIVRDRLQREWWVNCSKQEMRTGFQLIRKKIDGSLSLPYQLKRFGEGLEIRSCYLGEDHWVSLERSGRVKFWEKTRSNPSLHIGLDSLITRSSSLCMIGSKRCVIVTKQNTYVLDLATQKILQISISPPNHSVFRWSDHQVVFANCVDKTTHLSLCSIGDRQCAYERNLISCKFKVHQVIPCNEESGIICTPKHVGIWRLGQNGSGTKLYTSTTDTFWKILPLNHDKIVLRDGEQELVQVWNIEQSKKERSYVYSPQPQMTKLPNASFLLYAQNEKQALFVDPLMPKPIHAFTSPETGFTGAVWMGNGPYVVTSCNKTIHFWDMRRHQSVHSVALPKPMYIVDKMASGDLFLQDFRDRFVALLTPSCTSKNPKSKMAAHIPQAPASGLWAKIKSFCEHKRGYAGKVYE